MRVEPDCSGRCACSQTAAHSAIASITSRRKSFGCGLVKRIRSIPSTASTARRSSAKPEPTSRPYELTFWPRSVTSRTPSRGEAARSRRGSRRGGGRSRARGRRGRCSTSRRSCSPSRPAPTPGSAARDAWAAVRRRPARRPVPKLPRATPSPPAPSQSREMGDRAGAERDVDVRVEVEDALPLRLRVAAADGDDRFRPFALALGGVPHVRGEALVGLLADRARVEDEDVRLVRDRPPRRARAPRARP